MLLPRLLVSVILGTILLSTRPTNVTVSVVVSPRSTSPIKLAAPLALSVPVNAALPPDKSPVRVVVPPTVKLPLIATSSRSVFPSTSNVPVSVVFPVTASVSLILTGPARTILPVEVTSIVMSAPLVSVPMVVPV